METGREFRLLLTGSDSKMLIWGGGPGDGAMPCKKKDYRHGYSVRVMLQLNVRIMFLSFYHKLKQMHSRGQIRNKK